MPAATAPPAPPAPSLQECLAAPLQAIKRALQAEPPHQIGALFRAHFADQASLALIPSFAALFGAGQLQSHAGRLVRFRCMVQDPGLGQELFVQNAADGTLLAKYTDSATFDGDDVDGGDVEVDARSVGYGERQLQYCVTVPGQSGWVSNGDEQQYQQEEEHHQEQPQQQNQEQHQTQIEPQPSERPSGLTHKHSLPASAKQPHAVVKFYDTDPAPRAAQHIEVVGVLEQTHVVVGHGSFGETPGEAVAVPCIHAVFWDELPELPDIPHLPRSQPAGGSVENERRAALDHLASRLDGDRTLAEYVLLYLLGHTRHDSSVAVGKLSLNIYGIPRGCDDFAARLSAILAELTHSVVTVSLSISALNEQRFVPANTDANDLSGGLLQLVAGTSLVVDEVAMHEGQLSESGVRNVRALQRLVLDDKLEYDFPYQAIAFGAHTRAVVVSNGKSFLPADIRIPLAAPAEQQPEQEQQQQQQQQQQSEQEQEQHQEQHERHQEEQQQEEQQEQHQEQHQQEEQRQQQPAQDPPLSIDRVRAYIAECRSVAKSASGLDISAEMSKLIQDDFVAIRRRHHEQSQQRQQQSGGNNGGAAAANATANATATANASATAAANVDGAAEELAATLLAARLIAFSRQSAQLTPETWAAAKQLDAARRSRMSL